MEIDQEGFVLGSNWTDLDFRTVGEREWFFIPAGIGADGQTRQLRPVRMAARYDHSGTQRDQPLRGRQQRIDIDLFDPALLGDELAEPDQELLEGGQVDGLPP